MRPASSQPASYDLRVGSEAYTGYCGLYQGRDMITSNDIEHLLQAKAMVYSEVLQMLSSLNKTVAVVAQKLDRLDTGISTLKWFIGASIALFAVLVGLVAIIK